MKALSRILIFFGILWCLLGGYYVWLQLNPTNLKFESYSPSVVKAEAKVVPSPLPTIVEEKQSMPTRIVIDDLRIDLPLYQATITNDIWPTVNNGASYLVSSPIPGTTGNSIIYGHNWANLLGNLVYAKPGQEIDVLYADGTQQKFIVEYTSTVLPSASSILAPSEDRRITIYTCTGFLDSKRFVVVAFLEDDVPSFRKVLDTK